MTKRKVYVLFFALCMFFATSSVSAAGEVQLSASALQLQKGETVTIDLISHADEAITKGSFTTITTSRHISLVSVNTPTGVVAENTDSETTFTAKNGIKKGEKIATITIKILPTAPISTTGNIVVSALSVQAGGTPIKVANLNALVTVVEEKEKSKNADLSSLTSSYATFDFLPTKTTYSCEVESDVKRFDLKAEAADQKANVSISNQSLQEGENRVIVSVIAESGDKKEYTVTVTRKAEKEDKVTVKQTGTMSRILVLGLSILIILVDVWYIKKYRR